MSTHPIPVSQDMIQHAAYALHYISLYRIKRVSYIEQKYSVPDNLLLVNGTAVRVTNYANPNI